MITFRNIALIFINTIFIFNIAYAQSDFDPNEYGWKQNTNMEAKYINRTYLDVQFLESDPNYGWICGFQGTILRTTDGGESWDGIELFGNIPAGAGQLESIQFLNKDVGYVTVASLPTDGRGATFKSTDGGITWRRVLLPTIEEPVSFWGHHFLNEDYGFVLGGSCGSEQYFFKTENGGNTWKQIVENGNGIGDNKLSDPLLFENGIGYAVSSGYIWETNDYGESWDNTILTTRRYSYILGTPITSFFSSAGELQYTTQNGIVITLRYVDINRIEVTSDTESKYISWNYNGYITTSTNDTLFIKGNGSFLDLSESYIFRDESYEFNWHEEITKIGDSFFIPYSRSCDGTNTEPGGFLFSTDAGETWNEITSIGPNYGTFLLDELRGWGCGFNETVIYTSDGGLTWEDVDCGFEDGTNLDDIWFIDDTTGWVAGDGIYELTKIQKIKPEIDKKDTLLLCRNSSVTLEVTEDFADYRWNNGRTTKSITVYEPGEYYLYAYKNFICDLMFSDTVYVELVEPRDLSINSNGSDPLCEGDVATLTANDGFLNYEWSTGENSQSIDVSESGTYIVTAMDSNGCETIAEYNITFNPVPESRIEVDNELSICRAEILNLTGKPDGLNYLWVYKTTADSQEQIAISQEQSFAPDETGYYQLFVTNQFGCGNTSDMIFVEIIDDTNRLTFRFDPQDIPVEIDSTNFPNLTCRNLIIENNSPDPQIIDGAYLVRNFAFSLPVTQFPILVDSWDQAVIKVCYSPTELKKQRDTLIVQDICTDHVLPLVATGLGNSYSSNSRCNIALEINTVDILNEYSHITGDAFPNPASSKVSINFSRSAPNNSNDRAQYILYDSMNRKIMDGKVKITSVKNSGELTKQIGNVEFNIDDLPSGAYFIMIKFHDKIEIKPLVITK